MEQFFQYLTEGNLVSSLFIWVVVLVSIFLLWKNVKKMFDNDSAKDVVKQFKQKRIGIMELILVLLNFVAAMITSSMGSGSGEIHFALRFSQHFGIAILSAAMGFAIFDEVSESIEAWVRLINEKEYPILRSLDALKQTFWDFGLTFAFAWGGPVINYYIMLKYTGELADFKAGLAQGSILNPVTWINAAENSLTRPVSYAEFWMTAGHILGVLYLGGSSFDSLKKKYFDKPEPKPLVIPENDMARFFSKWGLPKQANETPNDLNTRRQAWSKNFLNWIKEDGSTQLEKTLKMEDIFVQATHLTEDILNRKGSTQDLVQKNKKLQGLLDQVFKEVPV
jgi:hypothetical protein